METSVTSNCEAWAVIKFLNVERITERETHHILNNVYGVGNVMSLHHIHKWIERFNVGQSDTHDEQWTGCLRDSIDETITCVCTLFAEDHRFTISDIHREMAERYLMQSSYTTILRILTEEMEMRKVSSRGVPLMLIENNHKIVSG